MASMDLTCFNQVYIFGPFLQVTYHNLVSRRLLKWLLWTFDPTYDFESVLAFWK